MRRVRSISFPIILGSASVVLCIALLVGWTWVLVRNFEFTAETVENSWLLGWGIFSLVAVITVLVLFSVFLAREIIEGNRQVSFIDSVTHELRSPLAGLRLSLETLERDDLSSHHREQLNSMMRRDIDRLSTFIDDILVASRIDHGRVGLALSAIDVDELVKRCVVQVADRYGLVPEEITVSGTEGVVLQTDGTALETVIKNLLDNAAKYSRRPVHIEVHLHQNSDGKVEIEVVDHGIGIPPRLLSRVFDRFYRAPGEEVRSRKGTGLGLYVVKALVASLGGQLRAVSEGEGQGTRMILTLPTGATS